MTPTIERALIELDARLEKGAAEYRNRSFRRSVADAERELIEELIDQAGWCYVLWTMAAQRSGVEGKEKQLRSIWFDALRHRLIRNDRSHQNNPPAMGAYACMADLEILAVDLLLTGEQFRRRLHPIARALEVARWIAPIQGRRGGACDARTSD